MQQCKLEHLTPKYARMNIKPHNKRSMKTQSVAAKYRLNLEIKHLHKKKQALNNQLYHKHLKCAREWQQLWHIIQPHIDQKVNKSMKGIYARLNRKLEALKTT
jgi:hypothetical protein